MNSVIFIAIIAMLCSEYVNSDVGDIAPQQSSGTPTPPVTDICLGCICEAVSGCNRSLTCDGNTCGLFRITWAYWSDGGKPTQGNESPDAQNAYSNCVNEPYCAARAVQGYMAKFGQDCNGDGVINCIDHAAIHKLGGYGCRSPLPDYYKNRFDQCLVQAQSYQG